MKVLAYHRVDNRDAGHLTVRTEKFLRQIDYLEDRAFKFISFRQKPDCRKRSVMLTFDHGFLNDYEVVLPLLKAKKYPAVFFPITGLLGTEGMLNIGHLRAIKSAGFDIGSHTVSHPRLSKISPEAAKKEIEDSKKFLEDSIGDKVDFFAYPYGDMNKAVEEMVKTAGYKAAFYISSFGRRNSPSDFSIPRTGIYFRTNFLLFSLKTLL